MPVSLIKLSPTIFRLIEKLTARASRKRSRSDIAIVSEQHQEEAEDVSTDSSDSNNSANNTHNNNSSSSSSSSSSFEVSPKEDNKNNDNVSSSHNNSHKKVKMAPRVQSIVDSIPLELAQNVKKELVLNEHGKQVCAVTRHNMLRVSISEVVVAVVLMGAAEMFFQSIVY